MRKDLLKRLESIEGRTSQINNPYNRKIFLYMTTEELLECVDENTPKERIEAIFERAKNEYKATEKT